MINLRRLCWQDMSGWLAGILLAVGTGAAAIGVAPNANADQIAYLVTATACATE
jgi:hypothetical protein